MAGTSRCRSCGQPIRWEQTTSGRVMPLDNEPAADGNVIIADGLVMVSTTEQLDRDGIEPAHRFKSHFATCVDAAKHRKTRA